MFPRGACYANPLLQAAGFDVVTVDSDTPMAATRAALEAAPRGPGQKAAAGVQGNLDPAVLRSKLGSDEAAVKAAASALLQEAGCQGLIFNLGEGLRGDEDCALVNALVETVHSESEAMIKATA